MGKQFKRKKEMMVVPGLEVPWRKAQQYLEWLLSTQLLIFAMVFATNL